MRAATADRRETGETALTAADALTVDDRAGRLLVRLRGAWTLRTALLVDGHLRALGERTARSVTVDASALSRLDSAGAWVIQRTVARLTARGVATELVGLQDRLRAILDKAAPPDPSAALAPPDRSPALDTLEKLGRRWVEALRTGRSLVGLLGVVVAALGRVLVRRARCAARRWWRRSRRPGYGRCRSSGCCATWSAWCWPTWGRCS